MAHKTSPARQFKTCDAHGEVRKVDSTGKVTADR